MRTNGSAFNAKRRPDNVVRVEFYGHERTRLDAEAQRRADIQCQAQFHYHQTGVFGEAAAMRALGPPLAFCHEADCGTDFLLGNVEVDVKCSTNEPDRSNLIFDSLEEFVADIAILTRIAEKSESRVEVEVIGWTTQAEFKVHACARPIRNASKMLMQRQLLRPMHELLNALDEVLLTGGTFDAITGAGDEPGSVHGLSAV